MNATNLVFLGILFLLTQNGTISLTQALLLLTLLTTANCCNLNANNGCNFQAATTV